jgi:hypothetical protein
MNARFIIMVALVGVCAALPGCGSKEKEARERARMELEEKSRRETEAANKAITDMNRKMFGRKPADKPTDAPPPAKPEEKKAGSEPQKL